MPSLLPILTESYVLVLRLDKKDEEETKDKTNREILTDLRNQKPRILAVKKLQSRDIRVFTALQTERDRLLEDIA